MPVLVNYCLEQGSVTNNNYHKIAVLGGGSFGTILANMLAVNGYATTLWMRSSEQCQAITASGENASYLPGYKIDSSLSVSTDIELALQEVDTVLFAVPSSSFRRVAKLVSPWVNADTILISAAKGSLKLKESSLAMETIRAYASPDAALMDLVTPIRDPELNRLIPETVTEFL